MARRSKTADPKVVCAYLAEALKTIPESLENDDLREKVKAMIPVHHLLRDLGSSLLPSETAALPRILAYLKSYVSQVVHGDELMVVSGISEYARRARELRIEHGWSIITGNTVRDVKADEESAEDFRMLPHLKPDEYMLLNLIRDEDAASRWQIGKKIRNNDTSVLNKVLQYLQANVGKPVSGEELKYVAKNKSEWARRTRELRTDYGWSVVTKATGRPDLQVGVYLLEDLRQAPEHDRHIKDNIRGAVLRRDEYKCQDCKWERALWNPDDPRHLEVHHKVMHAKGGSNEADNLTTLCNTCHDERHRKEKRQD